MGAPELGRRELPQVPISFNYQRDVLPGWFKRNAFELWELWCSTDWIELMGHPDTGYPASGFCTHP
jgi:hypothetical protein